MVLSANCHGFLIIVRIPIALLAAMIGTTEYLSPIIAIYAALACFPADFSGTPLQPISDRH